MLRVAAARGDHAAHAAAREAAREAEARGGGAAPLATAARDDMGVATELGGTTAALGMIKCGWLLKQTVMPAPPQPTPRRLAPHSTKRASVRR